MLFLLFFYYILIYPLEVSFTTFFSEKPSIFLTSFNLPASLGGWGVIANLSGNTALLPFLELHNSAKLITSS